MKYSNIWHLTGGNAFMTNLFAGEGSPYWYEWTVGQLYLIDMLNPDNGIKSVVLQSHDYQCIDDVIVEYNDDSIKCIQVKHTRTDNNITFNHLMQKDEIKNDNSLIFNIAKDWQQVNKKCDVVIFTNRNESSSQHQKYPSISTIINTLKTTVAKSIPINKWAFDDEKMQNAWEELNNQLSVQLTKEEIKNFINQIIVETNQCSFSGTWGTR